MNPRTVIAGAAAIALIAAALYIAKKGLAGAAAGAVTAAGEAAAGAVVGVGQLLGIPPTNETECERAKREGRTLDASFHCSAGDFIAYTWGGLFRAEGAPLTTGDFSRMDRQPAPAPALPGGAFGPEFTPDPSGSNWGA